jgi:hypothetical protein
MLDVNEPIPNSHGSERFFRRRASSVASANSHFRNVAIFGTLEVAFGQTIQ